ncbi:MAG: trypsin-like serine protease [Promethearchaeota archaeon]
MVEICKSNLLKEKAKIKFHKKIILISLFIINIFTFSVYSLNEGKIDASVNYQELKTANIIGTDDRVRVTSSTSYPWSTVVRLHITWGTYNTFATGALIDKNHVLTAGHCVYSHTHGGWADSIKVVPGEDNGNEPYGYAWAIKMRCYDDWKNFASPEHDFALLTLDRDIGLTTGWMGLYTTLSSSSTYSELLYTAGYPAELDNGRNMYWTNDYGYEANEYNHWYYLDTSDGQSGGPIWIYDNGLPYILSVVTSGVVGLNINYGTRINQNKYYCIDNWISADETSTDKPDLVSEYSELAGYNVDMVGAGITPFETWCKVRNIGTSSANNIIISYYASKDTTISKSDYFIGNDIVQSLTPTASIDSHWSGTFPDNIPSGNYYIGWIIDSDNSIDEFKENNNFNFVWTSQLLVDATPPNNPTDCTQLNGTTESAVLQNTISNPEFSWSGAVDSHTSVVGYYYYWGGDLYGTSTKFTSLPYYDPSVVNNGTYYLRVCTQDIVGNLAPWITLYVFKYEDKINNTNGDPFDNSTVDPTDDPNDNPIDDSDEDLSDNTNNDVEDDPNNNDNINLGENLMWEYILTIGILGLLVFLFLKVYSRR